MTEAKDWSVWHWLMEKRRVRAAADRATEALGEMERKIKAEWSETLTKAAASGRLRDVDPALKPALDDLRQAEKGAEASRLDAEATFDEAERRMSASLARQGGKAVASWQLREKAIRKAEALGRKEQSS